MDIVTHADLAGISKRLADSIASDLDHAIATYGRATLALSGGTTPALCMQELSHKQIDWSRVVVTLSDERWVDEHHQKSNHQLVKHKLLLSRAQHARFIPLYVSAALNQQSVKQIDDALGDFKVRFDVCVLGMGEDGHIASLFPDSPQLEQGLTSKSAVIAVESHSVSEHRISMTLPFINSAEHVYLLIAGAKKRQLIRQAVTNQDLPVSRLLENPCLRVYEAEI